MYRATLVFQDGAELALDVATGQTVLESAMQADAPLRYDCGQGDCGSCVARCVAGIVAVADDRPLPIDPEELADGFCPTCLTRLASDVRLVLPYPLGEAPPAPGRQRARVAGVERLARTVSRLWLELDDAAGFAFQPGQYLRLRVPGVRAPRAYSIASTRADLPRVELLIRHVPGGEVTHWLESAARTGDMVGLHGPLGAFAIDGAARRHVFVAGGTGLAPVLAMIRSLRHDGVPMLLAFGCTRADELFCSGELAQLARDVPGLEVRVALVEGGGDGLLCGTAVSVLGADDVPPGTTAYLCGPPGMVTAARRALQGWGMPPDAVRAERFRQTV